MISPRKPQVVLGFLAFFLLLSASRAQVPLTVNGVSDRGDYNTNRVTFSVPAASGYTYSVKLDGERVPTDVSVVVTSMDRHELLISRTNVATLEVTNRRVQFILEYPLYNTTERGYPNWTPYPAINAAALELTGSRLRILTPQDYPLGMEIPVVAWLEKADGSPLRANTRLTAPGYPAIQLFRGAGSGFLPPANSPGPLGYPAAVPGVQTNKVIQLESSTTWSNVSGILSGSISWPANSRIAVTGNLTIPAGSTLTIDSGAIVRLNPGVNITNNGHFLINGTEQQPVTFTPLSRSQPWGGFFMRTSSGTLDANAAIFVGSGAQQTGFPGHKPQQSLFYLDQRPRLALTNCAAIYLAGQFGHASAISTNASDPNWTVVNIVHTLVQRCVTGGEWNGCALKLIRSALLEIPYATDIFADADEDGIYFTTGEYLVQDSVVGWTRDDAIDSGTGEGGSVTLNNTWVECAFHEAFAWSGGGGTPGTRRATNIHCVAISCGQGYECGFSRGGVSPSPYHFVTNCLALGNAIGARFGDNYTAPNYAYYGFLRVTNSILLNNIRDVYGYNWEDWTYRTSAMDVRGNWLTAPNTNHPANQVWNPATDGWRLAQFMSTPPEAPVGIAFATWTNQFPMASIFTGPPVGLSCFTTNFVSVDYSFLDAGGSTLGAGTLTFAPGETIKRIRPAGFDVSLQNGIRVVLSNPTNGELTGQTNVLFTGTVPAARVSCWIATNQLPGYRLPEGVLVQLNTPAGQEVTVDFAYDAPAGTLRTGTLTFSPGDTVKWIDPSGANASDQAWIRLSLSNPVGAGFTGTTSVTYSNPPLTMAFGASEQLDLATFGAGVPVNLSAPVSAGNEVRADFAVQVSGRALTNGTILFGPGESQKQLTAPSVNATAYDLIRMSLANPEHAQLVAPSNVYFVRVTSGTGSQPIYLGTFDGQLTLAWGDQTSVLEQADQVTGPWTLASTRSPYLIVPSGSQRFFRLRK
ncbi:MAG TPA: hypothetical protein VNU68_01845 [Verrucomicrobiae bacterium]|nr:hypothetical protein [Verrucomicrobiae bacterium]